MNSFMDERALYKQVHDQVLDYADDEVISRCAAWGYAVQQELAQHKRELVQAGAEEGSDFMYAVATAVIIGEFAKRAFNDHFSDEIGIYLDLLDIDFEQIRGFLEKDIELDRLEFLDGGNTVGLQDMWTIMYEWKQHIHQSLVDIYKAEGKGDPNDRIFDSLVAIFENTTDEDGRIVSAFSGHSFLNELAAYSYVSAGFQY